MDDRNGRKEMFENDMITVSKAKMAEYSDVERFFCEMIDSMRDAEFKPEWEMGVYPTELLLRNAIQAQTLYLVHLKNRLVGVMVLNHDYESDYDKATWQLDLKKDEVMCIHLLGVLPSYHGRGIAKQMVSHAAQLCRREGAKAIRLDVLHKNIPAAKLYESAGFQHIDTIKMYYEDTGLTDFLLYELVL